MTRLWQATLHPDLEGRPTMITVTRTDGGPVTPTDAERVTVLLNRSDDPEPRPQGPLWWVSMLLMAATTAMLCAWAWSGEWRWVLTALLPAAVGLVCFVRSVPGLSSAAESGENRPRP